MLSTPGVLRYLQTLTHTFAHDGENISAVLIYAKPDPDHDGQYTAVAAADTGYEGIACVDDTARAVLLALDVYERTHSRQALGLARSWLTFVEYMQYPDGGFANFIRNQSGVRNATGATSVRGGYWWAARALWALARAYRVTGDGRYLERYQKCHLLPLPDGKINAVLALAELELYAATGDASLKAAIEDRCATIIGEADLPYMLDHPDSGVVNLWGYHQLHAVALAARALDRPDFLRPCRRTVQNLVRPDVGALFWYDFPGRRKRGVCAYNVTPIMQGIAAMYRATDAKKYRELALMASRWFHGRNDANVVMYDASAGTCRDGIQDGQASENRGAESAIEAGIAEMERRSLLAGG
ncbi:MAG: hypothetical protein ACR2JC_07880 [Chloroflexota bacterium]